MKKARKRKKALSAESIAKMADANKDVSPHFTNKGKMVSAFRPAKSEQGVNGQKENGIVVGDVDLASGMKLDPDTFAPHNVKERITTMVDQDALEALRAMAQKKGVKYQTLLNQMIRNFVGLDGRARKGREELTEESVRKIVREELKKRA